MKKTLIESPPRTIMEVFHLLPEGTWVEVIDGAMTMLPSLSYRHQNVVMKLLVAINEHCNANNLGEVLPIIDVYLDEHSNVVLPDITFISDENRSMIKDHVHGTPNLLIEVLTKGNENHDILTKKYLYEKFGVKEYWIVDPETKHTQGFQLKNSKYISIDEQSGKIQSPLLAMSVSF